MTELTFAILKYGFVIALWLFAWMVARSLHRDINSYLPSSKRSRGKRKRSKESVMVGTSDSGTPAPPVHVTSNEPVLPPTNSMPATPAPRVSASNDAQATQGIAQGAEALAANRANGNGEPSLLIVIDGPLAGATVPLTGQPITLGRGTSNTVVLDDEFVSSSHARVFMDASTRQWMLEDLGSTNGTFVNESKVTHIIALPTRVPVRIGATTFELR
jgi:hypothetical protein